MKKNKILLNVLVVLVLFGFSLTGSLLAEDKDSDEFYGSFLVGYRFVDVNESETKYMEDINLQKGPRLFNFKVHFAPKGKIKKLFDYFDIKLYNFGGDPFESFSIAVAKYGKYKFKYDRRKSTYFYNDKLEGLDFHTFSFDRINDSGLLKIWVGNNSHAYIDFNRYTKKGQSVTSLDIGRVEFEFDKPIDEESTDIAIGFDYAGKNFSILLEERFQDFENANSMFLPGYADGGDFARYPSALNYFSLNQPYDMEGFTHSAKFTAKPFKNLLLNGSAQLMNQETNFSYFEEADGIDYVGAGFSYENNGEGDFSRKVQLYDLNFTYFLNNKIALVGTTFYNNFDQSGSLTVENEKTQMDLKYESGGVEAGLQYQPSLKFGFSVGYRYEQRDVEDEVVIEEVNEATNKSGIFGNVKWKLSEKFKLTADYQYGSYDNPLTMISPTDFHRFRLTAKYKKKNFYFNGSYLFNKSESDQHDEMWESDRNQLNLRVGFHKKKIKFSAGYALIDVARKGSRTIFYPPSWSGGAGSFVWDILFEGTSNLFDIYVYSHLSDKVGLGGYFNYYENNGSWELSRTNLKLFLKYSCKNGFIGQLNYRLVNFKENDLGYNNYKANILEISFGYRWD